jgi:beta-phosphoglucomutase-like phosphatase (HAD superfamily)
LDVPVRFRLPVLVKAASRYDLSPPGGGFFLLSRKEVFLLPGFIFDMDGVIIDSEPLHHQAERALLSYYGVSIDDATLQSFAGKDAHQLLNEFIIRYKLPVDFDTLYLQHRSKVEEVFSLSDIPATQAIPLIWDIFRRDIPLALASSSHRRLIALVLKRLRLENCFRVVIGGDDVERGKPFPDIYLRAADRLARPPGHCIAIEDSRNGVQSAKDAGCFCIGYANPNSGNQDLSRADLIVHDFLVSDIDRWMLQIRTMSNMTIDQ